MHDAALIVSVRFAVTIGDMKKIVSTNEAPAAIGPYSQAVRSGRFLFCSGQIPLDPKSGQIVSGDIAAQTRRVLDNIAAVLRAERLTFDDVVKTTMAARNDRRPPRRARAEHSMKAKRMKARGRNQMRMQRACLTPSHW